MTIDQAHRILGIVTKHRELMKEHLRLAINKATEKKTAKAKFCSAVAGLDDIYFMIEDLEREIERELIS